MNLLYKSCIAARTRRGSPADHRHLPMKLFKASALWADAFYKSKCPSVCLSVCLSVCSLLRYRLTVFLPLLPEVKCQIFLDIQNPAKVWNIPGWDELG